MGVYKYTGNNKQDVVLSQAQVKAMRSKTTDVDVKLTKSQLSSMKQVSGLQGAVSDLSLIHI